MQGQKFIFRWAPLGCALSLLLTGCAPSTGTVTGTVKLDGKPLPTGTVTFIGSDNRPYVATISENGTYKIEKIPPGSVKITVSGPKGGPPPGGIIPPQAKGGPGFGPPAGVSMPEEMKKAWDFSKKPGVTIPERYAEADKSGLTYTVQAGSQTHDIELHSDQKK